jgi:hypothetical protein
LLDGDVGSGADGVLDHGLEEAGLGSGDEEGASDGLED